MQIMHQIWVELLSLSYSLVRKPRSGFGPEPDVAEGYVGERASIIDATLTGLRPKRRRNPG